MDHAVDLDTLVAMRALGLARDADLQMFVVQHLEADSSLLEYEIASEEAPDRLAKLIERFLEPRRENVADLRSCALTYAKHVARQISSGEILPQTGAELISGARSRVDAVDFHDLDPFAYAVSEMADRPEDLKFFENAILDEAAHLLKQPG